MNDPRGEYEKRVARWTERIAHHDRTHQLLAVITGESHEAVLIFKSTDFVSPSPIVTLVAFDRIRSR